MASIVMYEILRSIRLHPYLRSYADIGRMTEEESRKVDAAMRRK
jgi:hypothetical protein